MTECFDIFWDIVEPAAEMRPVWDSQLQEAEDYSVFQSYAWGQYKQYHGWMPVLCMGRGKSGRLVGMVQILVKKFPFGICAGWAPGGPVFQFKGWSPKEVDKILGSLRQVIEKKFGSIWLRFHSHLSTKPELAFSFSGRLNRPFFKINSEFSICMDLELGVKEFEQLMTSKHRYYVRQALAHKIEWRYGRDEGLQKDLAGLHAEMAKDKDMESIKVNTNEIQDIVSFMGNQAAIFSGYYNGEAVTACLLLIFGNKAFYAIAANGRKGRELSAAYAMIYQLVPILREMGLKKLDFAGLDPKTPSAFGVNHFKKGFGSEIVEYLGEWECATSEKLRYAMNVGVKFRGGRL